MRKIILFLFISCLFLIGCKNQILFEEEPVSRSYQEIIQSGELRILTLYSSTSYFIYKGEEMGYEFELVRNFAHSLGLKPTVIVANNINQLAEMLKEGKGDLVAFPINYTLNPEEQGIIHCGNENITSQVLVQRKENKRALIKDVTALIGKDVYVEAGTKYETRIRNLNDELGGGIKIHFIKKDSLTSEDLIEMVADGTIACTLADDNVARVNKTYHSNLDIKLQVSFPQRSSWIVNNNADSLATAVNEWMTQERRAPEYAAISKRYFERSKSNETVLYEAFISNEPGRLSVFDPLYQRYSPVLKWDWRLLAALSYQESRFNPEVTSWAGARGLMQLMPVTGKNFGLTEQTFTDPEANIEAGVKYIAALQKSFAKVKDPNERVKFVLGAFHAGVGHIFDAMALASKYGYDPYVWDRNVALCLQLKSNPQYYNDSIVKCGYFPGNTTLDHVNKIQATFNHFREKVK